MAGIPPAQQEHGAYGAARHPCQRNRCIGSGYVRHRRLRPAGDAVPVGAAAVAVPLRADATRPGSTPRSPRTPPRWSATCGRRPIASTAAGRTLLDVGGGPGYFATAFDRRRLQLHRRRTRPRRDACGPRDRRVGHLRPRLRHGAAVRRRQRGHLPVVQCRRACAGAVAAGQGDAAGHPARRPCRAVLHGVAGPVRRARDGPDPLPRRRPRRGPLRPQTRPPAEEQLRIVTVRRLRRGRSRLRRGLRRAGRRIPPLPPQMGVVDDQGAAAAESFW